MPVEGMTCASCAGRVEKSLNELEGVEATVNFATERATVDFDPARVEPEQLVGAVEDVGYTASLPYTEGEEDESAEVDPTEDLRRRLIFAAALSLPVLLLAMIEPLQFENWQWLSLQLATPVVLWAGWPFHKAAWQNLRHGAVTMDTLISVGTLAALGWSLYALFFGDAGINGMKMPFELVTERGAGADQIYLEVAAVVTTFILAGRYFEARAKRRAGAALEALLDLGAKEVGAARRRRQRAARCGRGARGRRPLRRPTWREGRDRRRRRERLLGGRPVAGDRRVGAGRGRAGGGGGRCDDQRRRPPRRPRDPRSARTRPWRRSPASSPRRSRARRRCSASPTGSAPSSSRS